MGDHKEHGINIDPGYIRELAEMLDATGLSEIEVEDGERKIRVARTMAAVAAPVAMAAAAAPAAAAPTAAAPVATAVDTMAGATKSPMVGTVYLSPEPGAAPYAAIGSAITAGDTILIIEAMKVMNPITAPTSGTLKAVHVENSQPVEFDQPLFTIA
ncbi:MAG: acetyl-CoA carboxylase biotin carboxyl carrier protein [Sphingopyxis sp.]|nr:acetyl-CoA carboxylase biotin carboxyl carrier protein [Sphingopyxis sp.]